MLEGMRDRKTKRLKSNEGRFVHNGKVYFPLTRLSQHCNPFMVTNRVVRIIPMFHLASPMNLD